MPDATTPDTDHDFHLRMAKSLFNHTWTLLGTDPRTVEQDDEMIHASHASRHHWSIVGKPVNLARGDWQLARVYAILGRAEPALYHARRCLEITEHETLGGFDLAFAHEALARASTVAGDVEAATRHLALAREAGDAIADAEDREHFLSELATIPGV